MKDFNAHREAARAKHKARIKSLTDGGPVTMNDYMQQLIANAGPVGSGLGTLPSGFAYGQTHSLSSPSDFGPNVHVLSSPSDFGTAPTPNTPTTGKRGGKVTGTMAHVKSNKDYKR